LGKFI